MKTIAALVSSLAFLGSAEAGTSTKFVCAIEHNSKKVFEKVVDLIDAPSSQVFFASNEYEIKLSRQQTNQVTLEIYDRMKPARSYAKANIHQPKDVISYSIWERQGVLDIECQLVGIARWR